MKRPYITISDRRLAAEACERAANIERIADENYAKAGKKRLFSRQKPFRDLAKKLRKS